MARKKSTLRMTRTTTDKLPTCDYYYNLARRLPAPSPGPATTRGQSSYETLCQLSFQLVSRKHSQRWLRLAFRSALRRRRASARVSCRSRAPAAFPLEPRAICVRNKVAHFPAIGSVVCSSARSLTAALTGFWTPEANLKKQMSIRCQAQIWSWH